MVFRSSEKKSGSMYHRVSGFKWQSEFKMTINW